MIEKGGKGNMSSRINELAQGLPIILGSGSPRRREILSQVGISYTVMVSDMEEVITKSEPDQVVMELAEQKASHVAKEVLNGVIIGADTVVASKGKILGKPKDKNDAFTMLSQLSQDMHSVFTGVCILLKKDGVLVDNIIFCEETKVKMCELDEEEIRDYIATGEPRDKAGAYAIQGMAGAFIERIEGDYYNVVGLPIARLVKELKCLLKKQNRE